MADIKWVKITTDMFDNRKIKHLRRLPDGNNIVLIWVMLLTMAGRCNAGGMIFLTENIPYTPKMLADELDFEENTVLLALKSLEQFNMITMDGQHFRIAGWEEYQNIEGMDRIREQNRLRKQRQRERKRLEAEAQPPALPASCDGHGTVTESHATDIEEDKEKEGDKRKGKTVSKDTVCPTDVRRIVEKWNELGLAQVQAINAGTERHKLLKKRIKDNGVENILAAIERIQQSSFLKGKNESGWCITFDWFIKPNNFPKVAEGNYDDGPVQREGVKPATRKPDRKNDYNDFMAQLAAMRE